MVNLEGLSKTASVSGTPNASKEQPCTPAMIVACSNLFQMCRRQKGVFFRGNDAKCMIGVKYHPDPIKGVCVPLVQHSVSRVSSAPTSRHESQELQTFSMIL